MCLYYVEEGTVGGTTSGYTGLALNWGYFGGAAVQEDCIVGGTLSTNVWNQLQLSLSLGTTTTLAVAVNGATATCSCCSPIVGGDTTAKIIVGPSTSASTTFSWSGYVDNIQASVQR